jgi:thiol-disulfide isomerase/thioredoxin
VLVHDPAKDGKYSSGKIGLGKIAGWIADFKAGKIAKTVKSEEPPKDNSGPVTVVTAKTLKDIVFGGKNVLIEFYAPWCAPNRAPAVLVAATASLP